ncbi:nucleotidyltransferase family protein [Natronocella acetinitrilica]
MPNHRAVSALILAAGASRRMGDKNKLLMAWRGEPMVRQVARKALASGARDVVVVTGYRSETIKNALAGLPLRIVFNPNHGKGMGTSLARGIASLRPDTSAVLVCLADMPFVQVSTMNRLIGRYRSARGQSLCVPTHLGRAGNPVLLPMRHFAALRRLRADSGARHLIRQAAELVEQVEVNDPGILRDIDDRKDWARTLKSAGGDQPILPDL